MTYGTVCWVQIPVRPKTLMEEWVLGPFRFVVSQHKNIIQEGQALPAQWPKTQKIIFVFPAVDVLLVEGNWPQLRSLTVHQLHEALPNLTEDWLLSSPQGVHFALGVWRGTAPEITVAMIDLAWVRWLMSHLDSSQRAVLQAHPVTVLQDEDSVLSWEWPDLDSTMTHFLVSVRTMRVQGFGYWNDVSSNAMKYYGHQPNAMTFTQMVRQLVPFDHSLFLDLCQFEFAAPMGLSRLAHSKWRFPIILMILTGIIYLISLNMLAFKEHLDVQKWQGQMADVAHHWMAKIDDTNDSAVLMEHFYEGRQANQNKGLEDRMVVLVTRLGLLLKGTPSDVIQQLSYHDDCLWVKFKLGFDPKGLVEQGKPVLEKQDANTWKYCSEGLE